MPRSRLAGTRARTDACPHSQCREPPWHGWYARAWLVLDRRRAQVMAMVDVTAQTYRQLAKQARASSAAALSLESRQEWIDVAADHEMPPDFGDQPKRGVN